MYFWRAMYVGEDGRHYFVHGIFIYYDPDLAMKEFIHLKNSALMEVYIYSKGVPSDADFVRASVVYYEH